MSSSKIGWAVTGAGHLVNETYEAISAYDNVELFISRAAEEVAKIYKIDLDQFRCKIHKDDLASAPVCGKFAMGHYRGLVVAPATSNTVAKFVTGISDTLITNIFAQSGKSNVPIIVFPTDTGPEVESMGPSKPVMVYPRKIDLENVEKLETFEMVRVVRSFEELKTAMRELFD